MANANSIESRPGKSPRAKLTEHEIALIAEFYADRIAEGMTPLQAARAFVV